MDSILNAASGLTALVGTQIYAKKVGQSATGPAVVYDRIATDRQHAMGADTGLVMARMQIQCWGDSQAEAERVSEQVRAALQDYTGTASTVVIQRAFLAAEFNGPYVEDEGYRQIQEYEIWHRE